MNPELPGAQQSRERATSPTRIQIPDTGLCSNQTAALQEIVALFNSGVRTVELCGHSGTGKTQLAEHIQKHVSGNLQIFEAIPFREAHQQRYWKDLQAREAAQLLSIVTIPGVPFSGTDPLPHRVFLSALGEADLLAIRMASLSTTPPEKEVALIREISALKLGSLVLLERLRNLHESRGPDGVRDAIATFIVEAVRDSEHLRRIDADVLRKVIGETPKARMLANHILGQWRTIEESLHKTHTVSDEQVNQLEQAIFGTLEEIPDVSRETERFYLEKITTEREPTYALQSLKPLTPAQRRAVCEALMRVLPYTNSHFLDRDPNIDEFSGAEATISFGSVARKSGIFVVDQAYMPDAERFQLSGLRPLVSDSESARIGARVRNSLRGRTLPDNTLIFAGGDHCGDFSHIGPCLALELILQKLKVPYRVERGRDTEERCFTFSL
jgi:hypothetical protein